MKKDSNVLKNVFNIAPLASIIYLCISILENMLPNVGIMLITNLTDCLSVKDWDRGFFLIFFLTCLFIIEGIQSSIQSFFHLSLQYKISQNLYPLLYKAIYKTNLVNLDKAEFLLKIKEARTAIDSKVGENFNIFSRFIGTAVSLGIIGFSIIRVRPIYLFFFLLMAILQNIFSIYNTKDSIKLVQYQNKKQREHDYFNELLQMKKSAKEIKNYGVFSWIEKKRKNVYDDIVKTHMSFSFKWTKLNIVWSSIMYLLEGLLLFLLLQQAMANEIGIGEIVFVIQSNMLFISNVTGLVDAISKMKQNNIFIKSLHIILNCEMKTKNWNRDYLEKQEGKLVVSIKNLDFSYGIRKVLEDINIKIEKGKILVIVGENGSGKSTLSKIIMGLLEPDTGDVDINAEKRSAVFQDYSKFNFTLRENIGFGEITQMANNNKISNILNNVGMAAINERLSCDYDSQLGKEFFINGIELSGGEWQKIAVARGLFGVNELLIFDEPTSAIDPINEKYQFEQIARLCKGKSIIIVSHRIGIVHMADEVLFMENGKIEERGTHSELMKVNGKYAKFYTQQSKWYQ